MPSPDRVLSRHAGGQPERNAGAVPHWPTRGPFAADAGEVRGCGGGARLRSTAVLHLGQLGVHQWVPQPVSRTQKLGVVVPASVD